MQKYLKMTIFCVLRPFSRTLKLLREVLENHQIFSRGYTPCIFSTKKYLEWYCTRKCQKYCKMTASGYFPPFWDVLQTSLEIMGKRSNFQLMFYHMNNVHSKNLEIIIFYFQSQNFTRKCNSVIL